MQDYAAIDAVNWSTLKHLRESPKAYKYRLANPTPDTTSRMLGRITHGLVLGSADEFVVWEGGTRRGKEWDAFKSASAGREIIKPDELKTCQDMADAVLSNLVASELLSGCDFEQTMIWTDPDTGIRCKGRADAANRFRRDLLDLKACRSIDGRRFGVEAERMAYPQQLAHYAHGCRYGLGFEPERVGIIAVEIMPPHDVGVFWLDNIALEIKRQEVTELLAGLKECRERDYWPGRYEDAQALQLPAWVYADDSEEDAEAFDLVL